MDFTVAVLAALLAAVLVWLFLRSQHAATAERARLATEALAKAETELVALRARATELEVERAALKEAQARLLDSFKALSADALRANNASFLELARETFGQLHQQSSGELEKRQQAIDALVKPIRESPDKVGQSVVEIDKARADAYGRLSEQLKSLGTAQAQLQSVTSNLSTALSASKSSYERR